MEDPNIEEAADAGLKTLAEAAAATFNLDDDKAEALAKFGHNLIASMAKIANSLDALSANNQKGSSESGNIHATSLNELDIILGTKAGDAAYARGVAAPEGWIKRGIQKKEDKEAILAALNLRLKNTGADQLLKVPDLDKSSGRNKSTPEVLSNNEKVPSVDLTGFNHMLVSKHNLTDKSVKAWSSWFNGKTDCGLVEAPAKLEQETLDFDATGNQGNDALVSHYKRQLRTRSSMLHDFIRNILTDAAYNTFMSNREQLQYSKKLNGKTFICGITLLWMLLEILKPNTVVDAQEYERIIESATCFPGSNDNPFLYCCLMRNAYNELQQKHGVNAYSANRYLKELFRGLRTTRNEVLRTWTQGLWSQFLVDANSVKAEAVEKGAVEIYHAQVQAGEWKDTQPDEAAKLRKEVALLTKQHKTMKDQLSQRNGTSPGGGKTKGDLPEWRLKKEGRHKTMDGKKWEWCDQHGSDGKQGMYMPCNAGDHHDHEKWLQGKNERKARAAKKRAAAQDDKQDSTPSEGGSDAKTVSFQKEKKTKTLTPAWKQKGKAAFVTLGITNYGMSEQMAEQFYAEFEKSGEKDGEDF